MFSGFLRFGGPMATLLPQTPASSPLSSRDRRFYSTSRAFGRFGMRIFTPMLMKTPHWHGHIEFNYVTGASMTYQFDGKTVDIPPNRLVAFWAGIPHQTIGITPISDERPRLANIYAPVDALLFMPHIAQLQVSLLGGAMIILPPDLADMSLMRRWYMDYRSNDVERLETLKMEMNALLRRALFSDIEYLRTTESNPSDDRALTATNIRQVVEMVRFILDNFHRPISNADVAAVTGLHQNYALSLFSRFMQVPMKRFVIRIRLLRARAMLLEGSDPISVIAESAGFSSLTQFYEHFRSAYGMTPSDMRNAFTSATPI